MSTEYTEIEYIEYDDDDYICFDDVCIDPLVDCEPFCSDE